MRRLTPLRLPRSFRPLAGWVFATAALLGAPIPGTAQEGPDAPVARKGFVINFGLGAAHVSTSIPGLTSVSNTGVGTDFKIGYAPNDRLLIYYSNDAAFTRHSNGEDLEVSGVTGVGATYFLRPGENSFYVDVAVGPATEGVIAASGATASDTGTGFTVGGGYEFARHWLLDGDVIVGRYEGFNTRTIRLGLMWFHY